MQLITVVRPTSVSGILCFIYNPMYYVDQVLMKVNTSNNPLSIEGRKQKPIKMT